MCRSCPEEMHVQFSLNIFTTQSKINRLILTASYCFESKTEIHFLRYACGNDIPLIALIFVERSWRGEDIYAIGAGCSIHIKAKLYGPVCTLTVEKGYKDEKIESQSRKRKYVAAKIKCKVRFDHIKIFFST